MKRLIFALTIIATVFVSSGFAYDTSSLLKPVGSVSEYTKTDYTITEKFGDYYRSPKAKFVHTFDASGKQIEEKELTNKDALVDKIVYAYDAAGNLTLVTASDADGKLLWKKTASYDDKGNKTEESEFNAGEILVSKSIWKLTSGKQSEKSNYDVEGALLGKIITKFDEQGRDSEVCEYSADGNLSQKLIYTYNEAGKLSEVAYYDENETLKQRLVYRFDTSFAVTEEQTYDAENKLRERVIYKYDAEGNITRTTKYAVAEKFGGIVNELIDINEFSYKYGSETVPVVTTEIAPM